jgi:Flp pilus assembly protein TadD
MQRAKDDYNAALLLAPADARTWNNRGALQEDCGNLVAAGLDLKRALELDGSYAKAAENYARVSSLLEPEVELRLLSATDADKAAQYACALTQSEADMSTS